jgi:ribose transport system permease protein
LGGEVTLCVVAIAFTLPLMVGQLDLSVASVAGLASVAATAAMSFYHAPLVVAVTLALVVGLLVGTANGYLIAILGLDSIIVTLAGMTLIAGIVQWYTQGLSINTGISSALTNFGSLYWLGIPRVTYLLVILAGLSWYLIEKTPFGRYVRMIGSNRSAARLVGLPVRWLMFLVFALTGVFAGVGGVLLTARSGGTNPLDAPGLLLPGLAAVYLGATTIQPGRFNIVGTVLGVFFVATAVSGLTLCGVPPFVEQLFDGGALLLAVGLSRGLGTVRGGGGSIGT